MRRERTCSNLAVDFCEDVQRKSWDRGIQTWRVGVKLKYMEEEYRKS